MTTLVATADDQLADDVDEYAAYIRQVTGDGEAIVDCLIRIMEDDSVGAKPYERLDAQLLLDSIGFGRIAVDQASATPSAGALPAPPPMPAAPGSARAANDATPRRPVLLLSEETLFHLPPIVRQKTGRGRKMADFLTAVVRGEMKDFKPHHWIRAAEHLAARAYSREVDPERPGLSAQDAMKLIDRLFPGFKHYHRVDMKPIIHLGFQDMAADDDKPLNGSAAPRPHDRPDFEAARAQYEAGVRAETERRAEHEAEAEATPEVEDEPEAEPEPFPHMSGFEALRARYEARLRAEAKRRYLEEDGSDPADRRSESETEGVSDPPDDYESRPGRPVELSRWERKVIEKGLDLGWDCGIPP